ncbi:MAG: hypothetical protein Q7R45_03735 [Sulfuricaulis sp.]|nr:hypothetical protein [Sulfuricaulis sp.]
MTTIETPTRPPARTAAVRPNIKRIEAIAVSLPMTEHMKMAGVEIRSADNLLIKLELESGHPAGGA